MRKVGMHADVSAKNDGDKKKLAEAKKEIKSLKEENKTLQEEIERLREENEAFRAAEAGGDKK